MARTRARRSCSIVVSAAVGNLALTSLLVLGPLVAREFLGGAPDYGAIVAAQGAGLIAGGLLALRWRPARPLFVSMLALLPEAVEIAFFAGVRVTALIALSGFCAGAGAEIFGVNWITALHQHIPARVLSRVSSYDALGSFVLIPLGMVLAGPLAARLGLTEALWAFFAVGFASVVGALLSRDVRTLRRVDEPVYTEAEARSAAAS